MKACLSLSVDVKPRRFIAVDEACVKANGLGYYVFSAVDVDGNEVVCMKVTHPEICLQLNHSSGGYSSTT